MLRRKVALFSLVCIAATHIGAEQRQRPVVRVSVDVSAPEELHGLVTSYLTRELRKIDDVIVTDSNPFLSIHCIATKNYNRAGYNIGYTLAFATTTSVPGKMTMLIAAPKLPESDARWLANLNTNLGVLVDFFVQNCGSDELQKVCRDLGAKIDGELIENARQFAQQYVDANATPIAGDDFRAAPSITPPPGINIETVDQRKREVNSAPAQSGQIDRRTATVTVPPNQELHMRAEHNSRSLLIGTLHNGDRVFVEKEGYQNNDPPVPITWQKITTTSGHSGWVNAEYISSE